ncbi:unnamed protein product, partial [Arctogadus glacialis]
IIWNMVDDKREVRVLVVVQAEEGVEEGVEEEEVEGLIPTSRVKFLLRLLRAAALEHILQSVARWSIRKSPAAGASCCAREQLEYTASGRARISQHVLAV